MSSTRVLRGLEYQKTKACLLECEAPVPTGRRGWRFYLGEAAIAAYQRKSIALLSLGEPESRDRGGAGERSSIGQAMALTLPGHQLLALHLPLAFGLVPQ